MTSENPLLQFVARSTVASYASSARLEPSFGDGEWAEDADSYALTRRLADDRPDDQGRAHNVDLLHPARRFRHARRPAQPTLGAGSASWAARSRSFLADLDRSGDGDRVTVLIFSEFGRRLRENASAGTDHGTAAPVFLLGRRVQGGVHGPYPDLAHLKDDDPEHAIDFRRVYATVLDRWLKLPADATLGASFEPLPLFRA